MYKYKGFKIRGLRDVHPHLENPQVQLMHPLVKCSSAPHTGQGLTMGLSSLGGVRGATPSSNSLSISSCISINAFPTAEGQQDPREVSPLVALRTAYEGQEPQDLSWSTIASMEHPARADSETIRDNPIMKLLHPPVLPCDRNVSLRSPVFLSKNAVT